MWRYIATRTLKILILVTKLVKLCHVGLKVWQGKWLVHSFTATHHLSFLRRFGATYMYRKLSIRYFDNAVLQLIFINTLIYKVKENTYTFVNARPLIKILPSAVSSFSTLFTYFWRQMGSREVFTCHVCIVKPLKYYDSM
jgi:hypothetical protein